MLLRRLELKALIIGIAIFALRAGAPAGEPPVDFAKDIKPILAESCLRCHGVDPQEPQKRAAGNYRLDDMAMAMKGGKSGPAIVPGKAKDSLLYKLLLGPVKIKGREIPLMPKTWGGGKGGPKSLAAEKVELIKKWIDQGAKWPKETKVAKDGAKDGAKETEEPGDTADAGDGKDSKSGKGTKDAKGAKNAKTAKGTKDQKVDFAKDVQPILAESCIRCHGAPDAKDPRKKSSGGLRLDDLVAALKGGKSGKAILPGKAKDSLLYKLLLGPARVGGREISSMPKGPPGEESKLAPEKVELIRLWIDQGARPPAKG